VYGDTGLVTTDNHSKSYALSTETQEQMQSPDITEPSMPRRAAICFVSSRGALDAPESRQILDIPNYCCLRRHLHTINPRNIQKIPRTVAVEGHFVQFCTISCNFALPCSPNYPPVGYEFAVPIRDTKKLYSRLVTWTFQTRITVPKQQRHSANHRRNICKLSAQCDDNCAVGAILTIQS
jgi:hypothetical protein